MKDRLLPFFDAHRSIPLYLLGTMAVTLLIQFAVDWVNDPGVWQASYTLTLFVLLLTLLAFGVVWYQSRPKRIYLLDERKPQPCEGLILLISQTEGAAPAAIAFHQERLRHCWLLTTPQSTKTAAVLMEKFRDSSICFHYGSDYEVCFDDAASTHRVVRRILETELPAQQLQTDNVIADITGGSKPMTAGMFIASLTRQVALQYIVAQKDTTGRAVPGALGEPIRLDTSFLPNSASS